MHVSHLQLRDFRNLPEVDARFSSGRVILLGENAQGKTNLLESIALLATGRSPAATRDAELVRFGAPNARLELEVQTQAAERSLAMLLTPGRARKVALDGLTQKRAADALGKLVVVAFRAADLGLVRGAPSERRSHLDALLVQLMPRHHAEVNEYERALAQRNRALRQVGEGSLQARDVAPWDAQLVALAVPIWRRRSRLAAALSEPAATWHERLALGRESLALRFVPGCQLGEDPSLWAGEYQATLEAERGRDLARGLTHAGPHRDDVEILLQGHPARVFASQGQQRTAVLAMKLAELELATRTAGEAPVLLLDDVLAELDEGRQAALLEAVGPTGQSFVTTTHLGDFGANWLAEAEVRRVVGGRLLEPGA